MEIKVGLFYFHIKIKLSVGSYMHPIQIAD